MFDEMRFFDVSPKRNSEQKANKNHISSERAREELLFDMFYMESLRSVWNVKNDTFAYFNKSIASVIKRAYINIRDCNIANRVMLLDDGCISTKNGKSVDLNGLPFIILSGRQVSRIFHNIYNKLPDQKYHVVRVPYGSDYNITTRNETGFSVANHHMHVIIFLDSKDPIVAYKFLSSALMGSFGYNEKSKYNKPDIALKDPSGFDSPSIDLQTMVFERYCDRNARGNQSIYKIFKDTKDSEYCTNLLIASAFDKMRDGGILSNEFSRNENISHDEHELGAIYMKHCTEIFHDMLKSHFILK